MGEAKRHKAMGLVPRILKPGEQIQVGPEILKHAVPKVCPCGCKFFIPVVAVSTISALVSPVGQSLTIQQPYLVCMECKKPYVANPNGAKLAENPVETNPIEE